jgi:YidC/Oxa1 family membrane protein insertase
MLSSLFHTFLYVPIYNLLIAFADIVPNGDIGIAVILVTVAVKLLTSPLSLSAIKTQRRMRRIEPELKALREKHKDNREVQAREMMSLYKNNGIKPFASFLTILIQIPVLLALYLVFVREELLSVNLDLVYSFVTLPTYLSPLFLGLFETTGHSLPLAVLAAATQYLQGLYTIPIPPKAENPTGMSSQEFARAIALQSRYLLPAIVGAIAFTSGAIAIYLITASVFGILQEFYVRKRHPELSLLPA